VTAAEAPQQRPHVVGLVAVESRLEVAEQHRLLLPAQAVRPVDELLRPREVGDRRRRPLGHRRWKGRTLGYEVEAPHQEENRVALAGVVGHPLRLGDPGYAERRRDVLERLWQEGLAQLYGMLCFELAWPRLQVGGAEGGHEHFARLD